MTQIEGKMVVLPARDYTPATPTKGSSCSTSATRRADSHASSFANDSPQQGRSTPARRVESSSSDDEQEYDLDQDVQGAPPAEQEDNDEKLKAVNEFPTLGEVKDEVSTLVGLGTVSFPSSTDAFPSARSLLIRLYAASKEHGFNLYRQSTDGKTKEGTATMKCLSGDGGKRLCKWKVDLVRDEDGGWSIKKDVDATKGHDHGHDSGGPVAVKVAVQSRKRKNGNVSDEQWAVDNKVKQPKKSSKKISKSEENEKKHEKPIEWPTDVSLRAMVKKIASERSIAFPYPPAPLSSTSAVSLRAHVEAAASQAGFSLVATETTASSFTLSCKTKDCKMCIKFEREKIKALWHWRSTECEQQHSHKIRSDSTVATGAPVSGPLAPKSTNTKSGNRKKHEPPFFAPGASGSGSRKPVQTTTVKSTQPAPPTPGTPAHPFVPTLLNLMSKLPCSPAPPVVIKLVLEGALTSMEAVNELVELSEEQVKNYAEKVGATPWERLVIRKAVGELKEKYEKEREAKEEEAEMATPKKKKRVKSE